MNESIFAIFEEYCDAVNKSADGDLVEVKLRGKYFTELYTRVMLHGWTCLSIISDESDNHIATFTEGGISDMLDEMMGDEFLGDDPGDWWKHQD
jgi:hypothetical protein